MFLENLDDSRKEQNQAVIASQCLVGGLRDRYYVGTFPFIRDHFILD